MIELREEETADELFIEAVYRSTREEELKITKWSEEEKTAFIKTQLTSQLADYKSRYPAASFMIIVYNKQDAGRFYTWENASEIRLIDITLLPQFRGKGIGTYLLKKLITISNNKNKKIALQVDPSNSALYLYLGLGFVRTLINGNRYSMEREPGEL